MRVLVIHCHPDPKSFNRVLCDTAIASLTSAGHTVKLIDLYADGFDARLSAAERAVYETPDPILDPLVRKYADLVLATEVIVFVYPTWWWGMPAMLKGWLERVMVTGVSFTLNPATGKVKPNLNQIIRVVGITTYGSPRWAMFGFNDAGRRLVTRCVRLLANRLRCRSKWLGLYNFDKCTNDDRVAFIERVRVEMAAL
jgi:NAD(P)H dehydrogenase (quinone)